MAQLFVGIGTGPGMGMTTASRFARGGFDLVLASKNTSKLAPVAEELQRTTGRNVETVSLEATNPTAVQQLADRLGDRVGVLHYNVAIMEKTGIAETSVEDFRRNLEADITGAFAAIRSFAPRMEAQHKGTILLTGGGYALAPNADYLGLSVGKAGIRCMAQALFKPLAANGVHIATFTVTRTVPVGSADATAVAEGFWHLHSEPEGNWTWEGRLQ
jgi:short-subunit dehydrogenase